MNVHDYVIIGMIFLLINLLHLQMVFLRKLLDVLASFLVVEDEGPR